MEKVKNGLNRGGSKWTKSGDTCKSAPVFQLKTAEKMVAVLCYYCHRVLSKKVHTATRSVFA